MKRAYSCLLMILISMAIPSLVSCQSKKGNNKKSAPTLMDNYAALADTLQEVMISRYLSSDGKYYKQDNDEQTRFHYWWNAHVLDVLIDAYVRTKKDVYKQRMKTLLKGIKDANEDTYLNNYYDDMEWLGLSSLRAYEVTKDTAYLTVANILWNDILTGLNTIEGGGFCWKKDQRDYKNAPANAPAIILACRLFRVQKDNSKLEIAKNVYAWLKSTLVDPVTGVVWDGINREQNSKIDKTWIFTYTQGVFIGAALELYKTTNDKSYLDDAIKNADYTLRDEKLMPEGVMKPEGTGDGGLFKGILARYLTLLAKEKEVSKENQQRYANVIHSNAKILYEKGLRRPQMIIGSDWSKKAPDAPHDLSILLSGMMLFEAVTTLP
jgi:predicted alpha-1,6-mannanase (GH76 family)